MRPLNEQVDVNFMHALRCVAYRLPDPSALRKSGYAFSLGLRYGLVGAAAGHHLLQTCEPDQERDAYGLIHHWPLMVEEHVRWAVLPKLPFETEQTFPALVSRIAHRVLQAHLALYRRLCPLEQALSLAKESVLQDHPRIGFADWPWWKRSSAYRKFKQISEDSMKYAVNFFSRREAGEDEVPEIALIGE